MIKRPTQLEQWETLAANLQADGYSGSVVTRKMIEEHGMPEPEAVALVGRLYGKKVNPRGGDTASAIAMGIVMIILGLSGAAASFWFLPLPAIFRWIAILACLGMAGKGAEQAIKAAVNAGVEEDLGPRSRD